MLCAGYPTKEERLIYGLGLGGSGQDTGDTGSPGGILSRRLNINQQTPHGSGTRCPHGNTLSTGEVCQHLSGMFILTLRV